MTRTIVLCGFWGKCHEDSSNLTVGPGSNVRLDKFVHDSNKGTGDVAVEASRGAFRFVTGSQSQDSFHIASRHLPAPLAFVDELTHGWTTDLSVLVRH